MAKTLCWPGTVKKQRDAVAGRRYGRSLVFLGMALILFVLGLQLDLSPWSGLFIVVAVGLIVACPIVMFTRSTGEQLLNKGHQGEMLVARALDSLPDDWVILNDLTVNGSQIDHLAVGPGGIFCIETKHWNNAGCDANGNWYRMERGMWVPRGESPAKQNMGHIMALKKAVRNRLGLNLVIESIVVLSNTKGVFDIKGVVVSPGNTRICWLPQLTHILVDGPGSKVGQQKLRDLAESFAREYGQKGKRAS